MSPSYEYDDSLITSIVWDVVNKTSTRKFPTIAYARIDLA
jgi:hypothetical protein